MDTPAGQIWIEVDESQDFGVELVASPHDTIRSFQGMVDALKSNAEYIVSTLKELGPAEIEATFGIVAGAEAGIPLFGLAKASGEANYTVKLTWKNPATNLGSHMPDDETDHA